MRELTAEEKKNIKIGIGCDGHNGEETQFVEYLEQQGWNVTQNNTTADTVSGLPDETDDLNGDVWDNDDFIGELWIEYCDKSEKG